MLSQLSFPLHLKNACCHSNFTQEQGKLNEGEVKMEGDLLSSSPMAVKISYFCKLYKNIHPLNTFLGPPRASGGPET